MSKMKKVHKMRGYRRGFGSKKKHRGKGSKGGKGYGGSTKHNRSFVYTKERDHFGHKGFSSLKKKDVIIKIKDLEKVCGGKNEVDLIALGYTKLLSDGDISKSLTVRISKISKKAKEKIEKAGGSVTGLEEKKLKKVRKRSKAKYTGKKKEKAEPKESPKEESKEETK